MITIETDYPIALDSADHLYPEGTKNDNYTNAKYIREVEDWVGKPLKSLDLGCSGGQLAVDFYLSGNTSVGLEGSDYSIKHKRANWPNYHGTILHTCDISKPFRVLQDGEFIQFNHISAWEVMEHIPEHRLPTLMGNIKKHLAPGGIFIASCAQFDGMWAEGAPDIDLHCSVFSPDEWNERFFSDFQVRPYPFSTKVRICNSYYVMLQHHE